MSIHSHELCSTFSFTELTKLCPSPTLFQMATELANTFPDIIKPAADLVWFSYKAWDLLGWKNTGEKKKKEDLLLLFTFMTVTLFFFSVCMMEK